MFKNRLTLSTVLTIVFLVIFAWAHIRLISQTYFVDDKDSVHSTLEGYGDIPLHLTKITKYAYAPSFNMNEPTFLGSTIHYHFLGNFISGLFLRYGSDLRSSLLWPAYLFSIFSLILLFLIYKKILNKNSLVISAIIIFYLASGLSSTIQIFQGIEPTVVNTDAQFPFQPRDFASVLFLSLIHQQAFFLGFFAFTLFIFLVFKYLENGRWGYGIGSAIVLGVMPFMHAHGFISGGIALLLIAILHLWNRNHMKFKKIVMIGCLAFFIALPQIVFLANMNSSTTNESNFSNLRLGWMNKEGLGSVNYPKGINRNVFSVYYLQFLWENFGTILPITILSVAYTAHIYCKRKKMDGNSRIDDKMFIPILFAGVAVFLFTLINIISLQPWDYDNNKILFYTMFFVAPFIVWTTNDCLKNHNLYRRLVFAVIIITLTSSGFVHIYLRLKTDPYTLPVIFTKQAFELSDYIRANIPHNDLILTGTSHLNPVVSLAGRQILIGHTGWLWSIGNINYSQRELEVKDFYQKPSETSTILSAYDVKYILVDDFVRNNFGAKDQDFDHKWEKIYSTGQYSLYKID